MISYYISFSALPHLVGSSLDLSILLQRAIIHSFYVVVVAVQSLSHVWLFVTPQTAAHQAPFYPLSLRVYSNSCPLSQWCYLTIICCRRLLLLPSIFTSIKVFCNESVLCIRWPKYLELQLQHQYFQWIFRTYLLKDGLVASPCSPRDSQESSPTPQFKSINSLALNL